MSLSLNSNNSYVKISRTEKFGYGLGDFASNLSFGFVSLFLLFYYTDIYGISAAQASAIFVIARVADAIFNLVIGYFVDKTDTRFGKLRPFILYGTLPLALLTVACFLVFETDYKFAFALFTYTLYCLAYTTVNTPYSAMTNMLTQDEQSRASLSVYRFALASIGYLVVSTTADPLVSLFETPQTGYIAAVAIYSALASLTFFACFAMTKERVAVERDSTPVGAKVIINTVFKNKPLINVSLYTMFFYIAYTVWMAIAIYFINYVIGDASFTTQFFLIQTAFYTFGVIISEKLIAMLGKKALTQAGLVFGAAGLLFQYFIAGDNVTLIMIGVCMFSVTLGIGFVTMWSMVPDTVEYAEWHHEVRAEGTIYGFYNFITKIAMAVGGGCAGLLLDSFNYSSDAVSAEAIAGINFSMTIFPAAMFILSMIVVALYTLNEHNYRELIAKIDARKSNT
ncbi:MFS transporter [Marinomonas ostreistagni]|uniref:MFS transporter n=1 Tax=Marinomonas ostreistagni TaxID=359209 RepID=UPI00195158D4|nr:MFS transporter [Marinomonas ostreistagni]MBM6551021.1 MFS transporter [Marinomonas ostreistagni]